MTRVLLLAAGGVVLNTVNFREMSFEGVRTAGPMKVLPFDGRIVLFQVHSTATDRAKVFIHILQMERRYERFVWFVVKFWLQLLSKFLGRRIYVRIFLAGARVGSISSGKVQFS